MKVEVDRSGEPVEVMRNSSFSSMKKNKAEDSDMVKKRNQKPRSDCYYEHISKSGIKRDKNQVTCESSKLNVPGKELLEQFQRPRQHKRNRALNDELKMKADELEKLFAEHKQRAEQPVSSQDRRPGELESISTLPFTNTMLEPGGSCSNVVNFDGKTPSKMVKNHNCSDSIRLSFLDLNFGDSSRGKFYEKYMQKRDAKLREQWSRKRSEKEAKMKAMKDTLEQSRAEMRAKFLGSKDTEDSESAPPRHTQKLRYFNLSKKKEQVFHTFSIGLESDN